MDILESRIGDVIIVHLVGRVHSGNAAELGDRLRNMIAVGCRALVLDLTQLGHMTSAGLRSLLRVDKSIHEVAGKLVLCGLQGLTLELFQVGGFLEMFAIAASREEALRKVSTTARAINLA